MVNSTFTNRQIVPFTQVSNDFLRNPSVSLKAKGLLSLLLSYSGTWKLNAQWTIDNHLKEGRDTFYSTINELIKLGYIKRTLNRNEQGVYTASDYEYSDNAIFSTSAENPYVETPHYKKNNIKNNKGNKKLTFSSPEPAQESVHRIGVDGDVVTVLDPKSRTGNGGLGRYRARRGEGQYQVQSKTWLADGRLVLHRVLKNKLATDLIVCAEHNLGEQVSGPQPTYTHPSPTTYCQSVMGTPNSADKIHHAQNELNNPVNDVLGRDLDLVKGAEHDFGQGSVRVRTKCKVPDLSATKPLTHQGTGGKWYEAVYGQSRAEISPFSFQS